jgi:hypothetical protein
MIEVKEQAKLKKSGFFAKLRADQLVNVESKKIFINFGWFAACLKRLDKWFGNVNSRVSNYVYLLCDSLIWHDDMNFGDFLNSIFYVGRGVGSRFMDHMREAQLILNNNYEDFDEEKVNF